jgi:hypothetical protein
MAANIAGRLNRANSLNAEIRTDPSPSNIDTSLANEQHANRLGDIQTYSAYCNAYAKCFPDRPAATVINACYSALVPHDDDQGDDSN